MSRLRDQHGTDKILVATRIPYSVHRAIEARAAADGYTTARYIALVLAAHVGADAPHYTKGRKPAAVTTRQTLPQRMRDVPKQTERVQRRRELAEFVQAGPSADARRTYDLAELQAIERDAQQPSAAPSHQAVRADAVGDDTDA